MPGRVDHPAMQEAGGVLEKFLASLAPKESVLYRDLLPLLGSLDADQAIKTGHRIRLHCSVEIL